LNQPTIVVVEDLHWIDGETQTLLDLLADSIANSRVLLLVNYRPEYRHEWTNKSYYSHLRLDALGQESAREMLSVLLGDGVELAPLKHLIAEKTSGNPFFIEEMVQALFDQGTIVRNGSVKLARQVSELRLPPTVQGILAARIDRLAAAQKVLMQTLAVIGRESPLALIRAVAPQPDGELEEMLTVLQAGEFIYEQPATSGVEYTFKHALTQQVAYKSLLIEQRKLLHERIGAALETLYADRLDDQVNELARHYRSSGNAAKAIEYLRRAAYQARRRAAYPRAVEQLETALGLVQSLPSAERDRSELSIRVELYDALRGTRGYAEPSMAGHVKRARELCARLGPDAQFDGFTEGRGQSQVRRVALPVASTLGLLLGVSFNEGTMDENRSLLVELWSFVRRRRSPLRVIQPIHCTSGWTHMWMGEFVAARHHFERSMWPSLFKHPWSEWAPEVGVEPFHLMGHFPLLLWILGYVDEAVRFLGRGLELAAQTGQPWALAMSGPGELDILLHCLRDLRGFHSKAEKLLALTRDSGLAYFERFATLSMGSALVHEGDLEQGFMLLRQALKSFQENGEAYAEMVALFTLAYSCFIARRGVEGQSVVHSAVAEVERRGRRVYEAEFHRLRGEFLLMQTQSNESAAEDCFREAMKIARRQQAKSWELRATTSLARLLQNRGKRDDAGKLLAEIYGRFTEGFGSADLKDAKALLDEIAT
jgi:tetratricopeptide (TPR) repeat protein